MRHYPISASLDTNTPSHMPLQRPSGVTDRAWDMTDVAVLIAAQEAPVAKRGPYKKKAA
jgi:hypothetical protein